jgi:DNA primase
MRAIRKPSPDSPAKSKTPTTTKGSDVILTDSTQERTPRYRGVAYTRPIDSAKEAVPIMDLADRLCGPGGLRRVGKEWVGRCPLPDHEDRSPSFTVNAEKNVFFCHGCLRGGDVVELARLVWGYDQRDAHTAAAMLLLEFGHEIPERPQAWRSKQKRQRHTREAIEETKKNIVRRRLFKHLILPLLDTIEDEQEREQELRRAWYEFKRLAA